MRHGLQPQLLNQIFEDEIFLTFRIYNSFNNALLHLDLQAKQFFTCIQIYLSYCLGFSSYQAQLEICFFKFGQLLNHFSIIDYLLFLPRVIFLWFPPLRIQIGMKISTPFLYISMKVHVIYLCRRLLIVDSLVTLWNGLQATTSIIVLVNRV